MTLIDTQYFKEYRQRLGFSNQNGVKSFFAAKDIMPTVDYNYIDLLNSRLVEIIYKINELVVDEIQIHDIDTFCKNNILTVFEKLKKNGIITRLNNQGRRPEQVYFSWMRGYITSKYFLEALSLIFEVSVKQIDFIGDDDLINIETFKRTPKADLEISIKNKQKIRVEVQSGYQGVNDIKQHKVLESKRIFLEKQIPTIAIHFDLFNGQVAFVKLNEIKDKNVNWITRQQMEGQTVFHIDQNFFLWKLTEIPPRYSNLSLD